MNGGFAAEQVWWVSAKYHSGKDIRTSAFPSGTETDENISALLNTLTPRVSGVGKDWGREPKENVWAGR